MSEYENSAATRRINTVILKKKKLLPSNLLRTLTVQIALSETTSNVLSFVYSSLLCIKRPGPFRSKVSKVDEAGLAEKLGETSKVL